MRIVLICPSNSELMPYLNNYTEILEDKNIEYDLVIWNRLGKSLNQKNLYSFEGKTATIQQGFIEYYRYSRFVKKILNDNNYDKVILFGIQLAFFMNRYLKNKFRNNYIFDIRDKHNLINFFNHKSFIRKSYTTVLSSEGFETWLPNFKYTINHNTRISSLSSLEKIKSKYDEINISSYGMLRDYDINKLLIQEVQKEKNISLSYFGKSTVQDDLEKFCFSSNLKNISFSGEYLPSEEKNIIKSTDMVNILRYSNTKNNKTALPNKLYSAVANGKPILAYKGTYIADLVEEYELGIVISRMDSVGNEIKNYFHELDIEEYNNNQNKFFKKIIEENNSFKMKVNEFIGK